MSVNDPARRRRPARRGARGSAAVELVLIAPFLLVLMAVIVDLRSLAAYRTDVARQQYAVVELIAGGNRWTEAAVNNVVQAAMDRMGEFSAGTLRVVAVARGEGLRSDGVDCAVDTTSWCEPMVVKEVRPDPDDDPTQPRAWQGGGDCAGLDSEMPAEGAMFGANDPLLPNEGVDGSAPSTWASRRLQEDEWWVVVEICSHFGGGTSDPGLMGGVLVNIGLDVFNASTTLRHRVAWGAITALEDDVEGCVWCAP